MVLTDDSFAVPSPCPFCPTLISSKLSAHYLLLPFLSVIPLNRNSHCQLSAPKETLFTVLFSIINSWLLQNNCDLESAIFVVICFLSGSPLSSQSICLPQSFQSYRKRSGFHRVLSPSVYSFQPICLPTRSSSGRVFLRSNYIRCRLFSVALWFSYTWSTASMTMAQ